MQGNCAFILRGDAGQTWKELDTWGLCRGIIFMGRGRNIETEHRLNSLTKGVEREHDGSTKEHAISTR